MEKKITLLLAAILCIAPGCKKRIKKSSLAQAHESSLKKSDHIDDVKGDSACFDEDLDDFVFVSEEDANPFDTSIDGEGKDNEAALEIDAEKEQDSPGLAHHKKSFKTLYYGFNQYKIVPEQKGSVEYITHQIKTLLKKNPKATFVVEGHACHSAGSDSYNLALSNRRGQECINYLVKTGVPVKSLKLVGRGSEMPLVLEGSVEEQAPNRRVDIFERESVQ